MGNVEHRDAGFAQFADDAEEALALSRRQGGGRFVHDDQPRFAHQRPRDVDQPVLGGRKPFDVGGQRRAHADSIGDRSDLARDGRPIDEAESGLLGQTQHDVFQHRHAGHERQLLVDETHPEFAGDVRGICDDAPTVDDDLAAIGLGQTRKNPDERGLACAVRPDEAVDLAGNDRQRHRSQRLRAAISLADRIGGDERGRRRRPRFECGVIHRACTLGSLLHCVGMVGEELVDGVAW